MTETTTLPQHAQSLRLTLRIGSDAIITAVGDPHGGRRIVYESFPLNRSISVAANLRTVAERSELMGSGFRRGLAVMATDVMAVPLDEYPNEDMATLFHSSFSGHEADTLESNVLPDLRAVAVFPVGRDLRGVLEGLFEDVAFMPAVQPAWQHLYHRNFTGPRQKLFAYFHDRRMDVFSYAKNRLRFANSFDGSREHDALYYLLYAWRQLGYRAEDDELLLAGDLPAREWLADHLRQYVRRHTIINPLAEFGASTAVADPALPYDIKALLLGK